jgi:predicted nucleic acid-binding protein
MTSAVDSSVLLDVLGADPRFGERSREALRRAFDGGALIACEVVWSEVRAHFASQEDFRESLLRLGVRYEALTETAALAAGQAWRRFCHTQKRPRTRVIADFLIAAHAHERADVLLSRDRGFFRLHFPELQLVDPADQS